MAADRGLTLAEVLISLVVLALGLGGVSLVASHTMAAASKVREDAGCARVAMAFWAVLRGLGPEATNEQFRAALAAASAKGFRPDPAASLSICTPEAVYDAPSGASGVFRDSLTGQSGFVVRVNCCDCVSGVKTRFYNILVAKEGGEWRSYPFLVSVRR